MLLGRGILEAAAVIGVCVLLLPLPLPLPLLVAVDEIVPLVGLRMKRSLTGDALARESRAFGRAAWEAVRLLARCARYRPSCMCVVLS